MTNTGLRAWQKEAFESWKAAGSRGIVEAVTGTGKTRVGIVAILDAVHLGKQVLVVTPSIDLLEQWFAEINRHLPTVSVGRRGNTHKDNFRHCNVLVSTVQSAIQKGAPQPRAGALLIADEVHGYGTPGRARIFTDRFDQRLGLTATLERQDEGVDLYIRPYFVTVIQGCDFARGMTDGVLAPVRVMTVAVPFGAQERAAFDEHDAIAKDARRTLISAYGCTAEPFGAFMKDVNDLSKDRADPGSRTASRYLKAFTQRRALLADCDGKLTALKSLAGALTKSERSIVFSETKLSAERGSDVLVASGLKASPYSSDLDRIARTRVLQQFRTGALTTLVAPKVLDEGIDVPAVDVGIIVASSSQRRQMIQRMGRILRVKPDGRAATFVILYVPGTMEDPAMGAHEAFLGELLQLAHETVDVPLVDAGAKLAAWLGAGPVAVPAPLPDTAKVASVPAAPQIATEPAPSKLSMRQVLSGAHSSEPHVVDMLLRLCATIDARMAVVLVQRFGLDGSTPRTMKQIGMGLSVPATSVEELERKGVAALESVGSSAVREIAR